MAESGALQRGTEYEKDISPWGVLSSKFRLVTSEGEGNAKSSRERREGGGDSGFG